MPTSSFYRYLLITVFVLVANSSQGFVGVHSRESGDTDFPALVSGSTDQSIRLWDHKGKQTLIISAHESAVNCLLYISDGKIISGGDDNSVKIWTSDGQLETTLESAKDKPAHNSAVLCLAISPNGKILATGGADRMIRFWNPITGKLIHSFTAHNGSVKALAWSPDGQILASGGSDRLIQLWKADGRTAGTIIGHDEAVTALAWTRDNRALLSGSMDGSILAWNIDGFGIIARSKGHARAVNAIALSPDGRTLASAGVDLKLRIWTFTGNAFQDAAVVNCEKQMNCLIWSKDGKYLVGGSSDKMIRYFTGPDFSSKLAIKAHDASVTCLAVIL